ncbi:hypothetical protein D3C83_90650 [compost metagenome]
MIVEQARERLLERRPHVAADLVVGVASAVELVQCVRNARDEAIPRVGESPVEVKEDVHRR